MGGLRGIRFGVGLQSDKTGADYAELGALAEASGFDVVSVFSDLLYQPPIYALLEMARATSRVRLGAACWNPYTLHPYEIAGQVAVLDQASQGRAYVGLSRGAWMGAIGVAQTRPIATLREAIGVITHLLRGDGAALEGEVFPVAAGTRLRYGLPAVPPPVVVGTWGPKAARVAGQLADEVKVGGTANPDMVSLMGEWVGAAAREAGRAPVGVTAGAVTVVDEDGAAARARARTEVAMYLAVVAELDPTVEIPGELLLTIKQLAGAGDYAAAGAAVPDEILDRFAFSGTPAAIVDQVHALVEAGATRIEFGTPHGLDSGHGIELLGRHVLPAFAAE